MTSPLRRLTVPQLIALLLFLAFLLRILFWFGDPEALRRPVIKGAGAPGEYLFCFWNVENLFDDQFDDRKGRGDPEYDGWFSRDPAALKQKLDQLCRALLELNDGRGPDILAVAEVESERAATLLQVALNDRIKDESLHYHKPLMKEVSSGRHIAPAILTRLPAERDRTQALDKRLRIVEGRLKLKGHELVVLVSHWTSRVAEEGTDSGRREYADMLYGRFKAMHLSNPQVDLLICGDFNDSPDDRSVARNLHAVADRQAVLRARGNDPLLLNLMAGLDPTRGGTLHHRGDWFVFDQIAVSPAMLENQGWSVVPDSVRIVNTLTRPGDKARRPWSFGKEKHKGERGYSDHFPVTVRLKVEGRAD